MGRSGLSKASARWPDLCDIEAPVALTRNGITRSVSAELAGLKPATSEVRPGSVLRGANYRGSVRSPRRHGQRRIAALQESGYQVLVAGSLPSSSPGVSQESASPS